MSTLFFNKIKKLLKRFLSFSAKFLMLRVSTTQKWHDEPDLSKWLIVTWTYILKLSTSHLIHYGSISGAFRRTLKLGKDWYHNFVSFTSDATICRALTKTDQVQSMYLLINSLAIRSPRASSMDLFKYKYMQAYWAIRDNVYYLFWRWLISRIKANFVVH